MAYADALIEARDYQAAADILDNHAITRPTDAYLWYKLAEVEGQAGNISKVHQARAEYYVLLGDYQNARDQLRYALRVESEAGASAAVEARLQQKIKEVEELQRKLQG